VLITEVNRFAEVVETRKGVLGGSNGSEGSGEIRSLSRVALV